MDGVLNVDKPAGLSSARVVDRVKRLCPRGTKVGHAGTLDPFATGVLLVLVGKATKQCERLMSEPKQYEATIKLGATTETLDPESPEIIAEAIAPASEDQVKAVLPRFVGRIEQVPPAYSALKIAGRAAYAIARAGGQVELKPRPVNVYGIDLLRYQWPRLKVRVDCGRGTYVRALARDIGLALDTAGYLEALRRTRVGPFSIPDAVELPRLSAENITGFLRSYGDEPR